MEIFVGLTEADLDAVERLREHRRQPFVGILRNAVLEAADNLNGKKVNLDDGKAVRHYCLKVTDAYVWDGFLAALKCIRKSKGFPERAPRGRPGWHGRAVRYALQLKASER
jgi:hypothetical protein